MSRRPPVQRGIAGLTLVEVLAAVALLGLLASAVVPLVWRLAQGTERLTERWQAVGDLDRLLAGLDATRLLAAADGQPLDPARPDGLWLRVRRLRPASPPADDAATHGWVLVTLSRKSGRDADVLGERLVAIDEAGTR